MQLLYFLAGLRTPFLNGLFSVLTYLGDETAILAVICLIFWCLDKRLGYRIALVFFVSGLLTQALKLGFRIERPWILDSGFSAVPAALSGATGYSFPSGHSQSATALYFTVFLGCKNRVLRIMCICALVTVVFSRLYLGVHTPLDVTVAIALTVTFSVLITLLMKKYDGSDTVDLVLSLAMVLISVGIFVYALFMTESGLVLYALSSDCVKSAGAGLGFAIGFFLERRYIRFETGGKLPFQVAKYTLGLALAIGLKAALKLLLGTGYVADAARYFVIGSFVIALYPLLVKLAMKKLRRLP